MPKAVLAVYTSPSSPEREDEYNKWYDSTHIPEVSAVPGFTGARRYVLSETQSPGPVDPATPKYLAIYDIDTDDLQGTLDGLGKGVADGTIHMSDALQLKPLPKTVLYELHEPS